MFEESFTTVTSPELEHHKTSAPEADKIYCANCSNCKLVRSSTGKDNQYQLRVRCAAGMWKKKLGDEKYYKYFTVARRSTEECEYYEPMGDTKAFLKELKKTLPIKDEIYAN